MADLPAFKQKHALKYGLKLVSSTADGDQSVQCVYEGRDKVEITAGSTRKRKERNSAHHFKMPFRSQNYVSLHKQHQASWEVYQSLSMEDKMDYFKGKVSNYVEQLVVSLGRVRAERDDSNKPLEKDAPPVLPGQLVVLPPRIFISDVLDPCREGISRMWSVETIDEVEADHRALNAAYNGGDPSLKELIDKHDATTTFDEA
ncbi:hypothetical protein SPRG_01678 [Saprolegnia parasitica CBS 223.65]|uniref:Uncharacterized protein n=1 Tax=Saprolegnia parasitica (strain CBS 223.65) TaxID=695850 RepID=A0A067CSY2_SAPPC|nr:hypothetical protein SPRG_01678 [Saprolegnia parasitica CBS 223.65]KDO33799.1 hypothetical protein SPRG_01678 [Saprolegnia parasitica CBS 223.65]|eukprot:XP_012195435.1 hypothetical protein SPRG_01678 [Saprolegnia parasitica CBS 223.65]